MITGIKKGTTIDLIRNIIMVDMPFPTERIFLYNEDYVLPPDNGLWIIVAYAGSKPYSNRSSTFTDENGNFMERQNVNTQEQIVINLMSFDLEALERKEEVLQALASLYSQNVQSQESFKIAPIMPIADRSEIEGGKINYRFDIMLTVLTWYEKIKSADYYDGIITKVTVADGALKNQTVEFNPAINPNP